MGLDMMLYVRKKNDKKFDIDEQNWGQEIAYWRKANHIHKYLCDNGELVEEEIEYKIPKQVLINLVETWMRKGKVIVNVEDIAKILPTQDGFFFGSTNYDEFYLDKVDDTIQMIEPLIEKIKDDEEITYYASW